MCAANQHNVLHNAPAAENLLEHEAATVGVAWTTVGDIPFAVDAHRVVDVIDATEARQDNNTPHIDLASRFALPPPWEPDRRAICLRSLATHFYLIGGTEIRVQRRPLCTLAPIPAFLSGLQDGSALLGLVENDGIFGYLLDVDRLKQDLP